MKVILSTFPTGIFLASNPPYLPELESLLSRLKAPFIVENAVLYAKADIALFHGSTSMAISLYRRLNSRLKEAWQTQRYIMNKVNSAPSVDSGIISAMGTFDTTMLKCRWSPVFPFRIIYSMGWCYFMEEKYVEAITEFFAILGTMPFKSLDRTPTPQCNSPGLKIVSPEALSTLCLEYIVTSIEREIHRHGPSDSMISSLMVVSQFLAADRRYMVDQIRGMILQRSRLVFPDFFRYIFDPDMVVMISQVSSVVDLKLGERELRSALRIHMVDAQKMQGDWRQILCDYSQMYHRFLVNASGVAPSFI
ncbi:hypothetical protein K493DRAFT_296303 [Basidiobolus meristosporus CBS 931.73]|uniref:Uncharacterized protein n=1 Tax=Basidiobolus meristosporus CBS 931.73 TaxID=1314790 RepID=A0A1Y1Z660_9FUNG|nr:hypothetical protein K493DRAFT_296303 [Basidiobolus meristosporus CBS 931.73]|eukprot:ORY05741.1 hypothetical protein K493DRAFT_296303 [Basidiobolus meristosporus CBS 931.73]